MARTDLPFSRWWLVAVAAGAMGVAGSYQFVWSSLRGPIGTQVGASEATLGTVFTLFVTFQTVTQFPAGWVRDRYGPRLPLVAAAILLTAGYAGTAYAGSPAGAALAYAVGGVGAGIAYTVAVNTPVKWFTDRRGLATGIVTMGYGGTSFLLIPLVRSGVAGFRGTLLGLAALAGLVSVAAVVVLRDPDGLETGGGTDGSFDDEDAYTWRETVRTWQFWLLYLVFVAVNGVGLMVVGKVVALSEGLGLPPAAATGSASLIAIADATGIFVIGGLSDRLGRERTIATALVLCGLSLAAGVVAGERGFTGAFVVLIGAVIFFRSPSFSIFPSLMGEYYGTAHSSENYALLYSSKLWGGVIGGVVASAAVVALGWTTAFLLGAGVMTLAGLATVLLRPV